MSIREYAEQQQLYLKHEVKPINWYKIFESAGYHHAMVGSGHWREIHEWAVDTVGEMHYIWHGQHFWFETEEDAVMCALKWS